MEEGKPTGENRIAELAAALGMPSSDRCASMSLLWIERPIGNTGSLLVGGLLGGFRYSFSLEVNGSNGLH